MPRVSAERVAEMTGFTSAWVRKQSRLGNVPGACKLAGEWRYDEDRIRHWIERAERQACRSISAVPFGGLDLSGAAKKSAGRLDQLYGVKQKRSSGRSARNSQPSTGAASPGGPMTR